MARVRLELWISTIVTLGALGLSPALAAPGSTCAEASEIATLPFSSSGTTCGAGNDFTNDVVGAAVCPDLPRGYGGEDVFFKLALEQGNQVAFDLTLPPGSTGDLALFLVRAPSCSDPQICAGNSVDLIGAGVGPERIKTNAQAYPTGTYYLIVDSNLAAPDPASCGAYALSVTGHLSAFCGNGAVDPGEVCDDGNSTDGDCCAADCMSKAAAGTVCRPSTTPCDVSESCNADGTCPANAVRPAGTPCRPSTGVCDLAELCDGLTTTCPLDRLISAGTVCRAAKDVCDQTESCTGTQAGCPADAFRPVGSACGAATTCQKPPTCNASAACVPGGQVSCEDGNSCTFDSCHPILGCLHAAICQDAGTDASVLDGALADAVPDMSLPSDAPAADTGGQTLLPDALVPPPDARTAAPDAAADSLVPGSDSRPAPADGAPVTPDSNSGGADQGSNDSADDLGTVVDAQGSGIGSDSRAVQTGDAGASAPSTIPNPDGGGTMKLTGEGGCSCRLGAGPRSHEGSSASFILLTLFALLALRRRTT
jgi:cysteine-rich repeat protein